MTMILKLISRTITILAISSLFTQNIAIFSSEFNGWAPLSTLKKDEPYITFMNYDYRPTWQSRNRTSLVDEVEEIYFPSNFPIQIFCGVCFYGGDTFLPSARDISLSISLNRSTDGEMETIDLINGKFIHFQFKHNRCYSLFSATKMPVSIDDYTVGTMRCGFDKYFNLLNFKLVILKNIFITEISNNHLEFKCCHNDNIMMNLMTVEVTNETGHFFDVINSPVQDTNGFMYDLLI